MNEPIDPIPETAPVSEFNGLMSLVIRVIRKGRDHERRGTFDNILEIAHYGVAWWFYDQFEPDHCDLVEVATEMQITDTNLPPVPKGQAVTIEFPVRIKKLDPRLSNDEAIEAARQLIHEKVSEGGDDFEGLEDFRVEFVGEWNGVPPVGG